MSSIMGLNMRTTMDIDTNITGMNFELYQIRKIIEEIISVEVDDEVIFEILNLNPIKEDNDYGGYKFKLMAKQSNIQVRFSIDVSTGDIITPRAIEYNYKTILEDNYINIYAYNNETIIAEKLETILKRRTANSRMKDYYDIYYFANINWNDIDKEILKKSINTTFNHRKSDNELSNNELIIQELEGSDNLKALWKQYQEKHDYAKDLEFFDVINSIRFIFNEIKK